MKIGFDAKRLYNNFTGLGNHSRTTIDILTRYFPDNEYILYTPQIKDDPVVTPYLNKEHCSTVMPKGAVKGSAWRTLCIGHEASREGVELFHGLSNEIPLGLTVPSVVTIHDVAFRTFPDMYHWQDIKIYDMKWRYACKNADRVIAISECTKRDIMRFYNVAEEKINVVYQPVSPIYYEMPKLPIRKSGAQTYMLYVGSVNSRKNLLSVVKAMNILPRDLILPLVVVGEGGEYKAAVERFVIENDLNDFVIFHAPLNNQRELQKLYHGATIFVYPSFYEGFGLPVVEAMLSGCPVLTSNVSSLPEAGGPYSIKADPASVEDIAAKMHRMLIDEQLRNDIRQQSFDYAMQTFHPKVLAGQLMEVYKKTIR